MLTRILTGIGIASLALTVGCGLPTNVESEEAALTNLKPRPNPIPLPLPPAPIDKDREWAGYIPPTFTYPDYGMPPEWGCAPCSEVMPAKLDFETWDGHDLWGSKSGSIMPYATYNTAARVPGDLDHDRLELFGVDEATHTLVWHMFAPLDPVTGGLPSALLAMAGTIDPYCAGLIHYGSGGLSSGKPPKDPPKPPDGTSGGCSIWCPAWAVEHDLAERLSGCGSSQ